MPDGEQCRRPSLSKEMSTKSALGVELFCPESPPEACPGGQQPVVLLPRGKCCWSDFLGHRGAPWGHPRGFQAAVPSLPAASVAVSCCLAGSWLAEPGTNSNECLTSCSPTCTWRHLWVEKYEACLSAGATAGRSSLNRAPSPRTGLGRAPRDLPAAARKGSGAG